MTAPWPIDTLSEPSPVDGARWIHLTNGGWTLVDEVDFDEVNRWAWRSMKHRTKRRIDYYAARSYQDRGKMCVVLMHRHILGVKKGEQVGHRDLVGLNNRRENLYKSTTSIGSSHAAEVIRGRTAESRASTMGSPAITGARWIPLGGNVFTLIDEEDFEDVSQWTWGAQTVEGKPVYAVRRVRRGVCEAILLHRYLLRAKSGEEVGHHDLDGMNNRRENLYKSATSIGSSHAAEAVRARTSASRAAEKSRPQSMVRAGYRWVTASSP